MKIKTRINFLYSFLFLFISIYLYLSLLISTYLNLSQFISNNIAGAKTTYYETTISAFIGEYRFTLFGYTSPKALVTFQGLGIFDQTYFEFKNRFSPFSPREACLTAQDQLGRLTNPVCLPPFPVNYNVTIGPVLMPPTLSLDKSDYWVGDEVILSGQSIPESNISLSTFTDEKNSLLSQIIKKINPQVYAFSLPKLETKTDKKGNFSIALPSSSAKKIRLFAQTKFQNENSPKSVNLTFKILPWWMIIFKFFIFLWLLIKPRLLEIVILIELIFLLIYFLRSHFHPKTLAIIKKQPLAIIKYQKPKSELIKT
jgi:hypothetical protein